MDVLGFVQNRHKLSSKSKAIRVLWSCLYFGCVTTIYNWSRIVKDSVVLKDIGGADVIYTLKGFGTIIAALVTLQILISSFNKHSFSRVFYFSCAVFTSFFLMYGFVLRPFSGALHLSPAKVLAVQVLLVNKLNFGFFKLGSMIAQLFKIFIGYWTESLMYVMCELYGSVILSFFFWSYMTSFYTKEDAKNIFPLMTTASGFIGLISSGIMDPFIKSLPFDVLIKLHSVVVLCLTLLKLATYRVCFKLAKQEGEIDVSNIEQSLIQKSEKKKEQRSGSKKALKLVFTNRLLRNVGILVLCYGLCMNMFEGQFKNQLALLGKVSTTGGSAIALVQNKFMMLQFAIQLIVSIVLYGALTGSWLRVALTTPIMMIIANSFYFASRFSKTFNKIILTILKATPISGWINTVLQDAAASSIENAVQLTEVAIPLIVIGLFSGVFIKICKYVLFDNSKERSFLYINQKERIEGKTVIDLILTRMGKGLSGQIFVLFFLPYFGGSILLNSFLRTDNCALPAAILIAICCTGMLLATLDLGYLISKKETEQVGQSNQEQASDSDHDLTSTNNDLQVNEDNKDNLTDNKGNVEADEDDVIQSILEYDQDES